MQEQVPVVLGDRSYTIRIGTDIIGDTGMYCRDLNLGRRCLMISNPIVDAFYGWVTREGLVNAGFEVSSVEIPDGEEYKDLGTLNFLYDHAVKTGLDRNCFVVALGGGVVGDIAGFFSATYMRGIPFIQVPTTILAQVDSSVGGKVAVNHSLGKNLIGAFYQPRLVVADVSVVETLPPREVLAGLAEVIKYGVIYDQEFFSFIEGNAAKLLELDREMLMRVIVRSCQIKAEIVAEDETEQGLRAILNFGHTFGHALEAVTHYTVYRHGEALAVGMVAAARLSCCLGMLKDGETERMENLLDVMGYDLSLAGIDLEQMIEAFGYDKKVLDGKIRFVLLEELGKAKLVEDIDIDLIRRVLEGMKGN
ncbi:MAG: 3-dehydroquinate synthase [Limnochordia bacterium]|jgi:3-dehydroquinate synthase|nr:3-dehydroquinate synthase [Limnochordia bacterium]